jgi:hypothetical protein
MEHMLYLQAMSKDTVFPVKKLVNLTEDQAKRISDFRFEKRLASENEAIRVLIGLGLDASAEKGDLTD